MDESKNRREFTRVSVKLEAELQSGGKVLIKGTLGGCEHEWSIPRVCRVPSVAFSLSSHVVP